MKEKFILMVRKSYSLASGYFRYSRVIRILTGSWFIAVALGTVAFLLLRPSPDPYTFKRVGGSGAVSQEGRFGVLYYTGFTDTTGTNRVTLANQLEGYSSLLVCEEYDGPAVDQWNFSGLFTEWLAGYHTGDFDHDSSLEFYCLSWDNRHIFLNVVEPFGNPTHVVRDRIIVTMPDSSQNSPCFLQRLILYDLTGDGKDEIILSLSTSGAHQPRKVYAYDIIGDSLWCSPLAGAAPETMNVADIDNDGEAEVYGTTSTGDNYSDGEIPYPDNRCWLMVFDRHLQFKYEPLAVGPKFNPALAVRSSNPDTAGLWVYSSGLEPHGKGFTRSAIGQFKDGQMKVVESHMLHPRSFGILPGTDPEYGAVILGGTEVWFLTLATGTVLRKITLPRCSMVPFYNLARGIEEFAFSLWIEDIPTSFRFFNSHGKYLGKATVPMLTGGAFCCWAGQPGEPARLLIEGSDNRYTFQVTPNPWVYLGYLLLVVYILGIYFFIRLIRYIQFKQLSELEASRKEVLELQLKGVRNQLDPHFTFNALNVLSGLSLAGDNQGVGLFVNHFSRLLRTHLQSADKILIPLREEIEFVVNFVELQRMRFGNSLHLDLEIAEDVDLSFPIPKMYIQTHVENAIKHGLQQFLADLPEGSRVDPPPDPDCPGRIRLLIRQRGSTVKVTIEDNGVGRGHSRATEFERTGTGLVSLEKIRELVLGLYGLRIRQDIDDLKDGQGLPCGTRVMIEVATRDA